MVYRAVSAESRKAKGRTDILIKDSYSDKELIAECLIWDGKKYYSSKKEQLFNKYVTWHNKEASLITFVRNMDFVSIVSVAVSEIKQLSGLVEGSFQDLSNEDYKWYLTENKHSSGVSIQLHHLFFHLPISDD